MKKFLSVLLLVLCLALPAAATETPVITKDELVDAINNANDGDTIVVAADIELGSSPLTIPSGKTLTLQISKDCVLSASGDSSYYAIDNAGNLTITGSGKITITNTGGSAAYCVSSVQQGSTTIIKGNVEITATASEAFGVYASSSDVTIGDSVKITATASTRYAYGVVSAGSCDVTIEDSVKITATGGSEAHGVYARKVGSTVTIKDSAEIAVSANTGQMYGVSANDGAAVNIFNGTVGGTLSAYTGSTITVYAGTFSNKVGQKYFAPGRVCEQSGDLWVVTDTSTVKFDPAASLDVAPGETGTVKVSLLTKDGDTCSLDKIEVTSTVDGITVTPSSTDGTITVEVAEACAKDTYEFKVTCTGTYDSTEHSQTGTLTVTVKEKGDDPTPTPTPSGDVKNGGCNAGFAGLALAAFALLAAKRKK